MVCNGIFKFWLKKNRILYRDEIPQTLISTKRPKIDEDDLIRHILFNNLTNSSVKSKGFRTVLFTFII